MSLGPHTGYVEETVNSVHVWYRLECPTTREGANVLFTIRWWLGLGCFGMVPDASCLAMMVYLELLGLVM